VCVCLCKTMKGWGGGWGAPDERSGNV